MEEPYRILIIDDSKIILGTYNKFFTKKNYEVLTAANGLDGIKTIESDAQGIDLVITDIVMPNISGAGVISIIKKKYPDIPVIAITGWGTHPTTLASEADADLILGKPIDLIELEVTINEMISRKREKADNP